jgi:pyruvate-formate lyase-activating enzyme
MLAAMAIADTTYTFTLRDIRDIFSAYRKVLIGLKIQSGKLRRCGADLPAQIAPNVRRILQQVYPLRRAIFLLEVADPPLNALVAALNADPVAAAEMMEFRRGLDHAYHLLSALGRRLDRQTPTDPREPVAVDAEPSIEARSLNRTLLAYETILGRTRLQSMPLHHNVETNLLCNLRCLTCHQSASQDWIYVDAADAPLETLTPAMRLAEEVNVSSAGETLLSRAAPVLVAAYKSAGVYVHLQTNGTVSERLAALAPMADTIWLSFDGGTAESYNAVRRGGNFDKLIRSLADLPIEQRRKICLNFVICKQNIFTAEACLKLAVELQLGEVHFQEMTGFLPWHDQMLIDDADRQYFLENFPYWQALATNGGVHTRCNLIAPTTAVDWRRKLSGTTTDRIDAINKVELPKPPPAGHIERIAEELEQLELVIPTAVIDAVPTEERLDGRRPKCHAVDELQGAVAAAKQDLAYRGGYGQVPHCLASYAVLLLNYDGTSKSCCNVQSSLSSIHEDTFDDLWNSPAHQKLRYHHATPEAPREQCVGCADPHRFYHLLPLLRTLKENGVDLAKIARPRDFPLPSSIANDPIVREPGSAL